LQVCLPYGWQWQLVPWCERDGSQGTLKCRRLARWIWKIWRRHSVVQVHSNGPQTVLWWLIAVSFEWWQHLEDNVLSWTSLWVWKD
jgi:hypothetical protein